MSLNVFRPRYDFKIFRSVIRLIPIFMMNDFSCLQISPKHFFGDKNIFVNIDAAEVGVWMIWRIDTFAKLVEADSTSPFRIVDSFFVVHGHSSPDRM